MANKERGEVELVVGDATYTLRLTINSICELEAEAGKPIGDVARDAESGSIRPVRMIMWAALKDRHPEMTLNGAGDLMTAIGLSKCSEVMTKVLQAAFPPAPQIAEAVKRKKKAPLGLRE